METALEAHKKLYLDMESLSEKRSRLNCIREILIFQLEPITNDLILSEKEKKESGVGKYINSSTFLIEKFLKDYYTAIPAVLKDAKAILSDLEKKLGKFKKKHDFREIPKGDNFEFYSDKALKALETEIEGYGILINGADYYSMTKISPIVINTFRATVINVNNFTKDSKQFMERYFQLCKQ